MTDDLNNQIRQILAFKGFSKEQIDNTKFAFNSTAESHAFHANVPMYPKHFVQQVLIKELADVVKISPWLGFICISSGIEFLGKCIDNDYPNNWNQPGQSRRNFKDAIEKLNAFSKYRILLTRPNFDFYSEFRCGLVHACAPKDNISLSHGTEEKPTSVGQTGRIEFNADELFEDFKTACEEVINMNFAQPNKMNKAKIFINCTLKPNQ